MTALNFVLVVTAIWVALNVEASIQRASPPQQNALGIECPQPLREAVEVALGDWQRSRRAALTASSRAAITKETCSVAGKLEDDRMAAMAAITAQTKGAIFDYLDRQHASDRRARTLTASFMGALGVSGLSRPVAKRFGVVDIQYDQSVDRLHINSEDFEPWPSILVEPGLVRISGVRASKRVCSGELLIEVVKRQKFVC